MGKELNWKEVWEEMQKPRMKPVRVGYDPKFRAKFADDYSEMAKYNNYEYGSCSHFLWQVKDLEKHLKKMENASRKYCAVIQPAGRDSIVKEMCTKITGEDYRGQFDPDADYFAYLILRQWGKLVNVRIMNYSIERNFEQEVRYIASFIGKYVEVDAHVKEIIEQHISEKGLHKEKRSAVVMW